MNAGSSGSGLTTAPTSDNAPNTPPHTNPDANAHPQGPAKLSETDFLAQQAQLARQAMSRTLSLIGQDLGHSVDPRAWAQEHPWLTVSGAAVGGFVAACMIVPTKEEQALKRLARIERAITPKREVVTTDGEEKSAEKKGLMRSLLGHALKSVQPAVMSALTAGLTAKMQQPNQPDNSAQQTDAPQADPGAMV